MRDFLKGWRRKAGCVTLCIALLFAFGWVRSISCFDHLTINIGKHRHFFVMSQGQSLGIQRAYGENLANGLQLLEWGSGVHSGLVDLLNDNGIDWSVRVLGFGCGRIVHDAFGGAEYHIAVVPYWSVVIPLTLLSAWLLLSESRSPIQRDAIEPASAEFE